MQKYPKISVITTSFNQCSYLQECIDSVLSQGYPSLQYIIIDGGSTDDSVSILKKNEKHLAYWVSEPDGGQAHAFNKGLALADGDLVGWLNSDDYYVGPSLFEAAHFMTANASIDIVFSDYYYVNASSEFLKARKEIPFEYSTYLWTVDCYHANCAGFFRRRVFDRIGGLREDLQYSMDYDFYLRAAQAGLRFGHVHKWWGAYRLHEESKTTKAGHMQRKEGRELLTHFAGAGVPPLTFWCKNKAFRSLRVLRKLFLGSYSNRLKSSRCLSIKNTPSKEPRAIGVITVNGP